MATDHVGRGPGRHRGRFKKVIAENGAESIVVGQGTGRDYESHLYRFANLLGTPNVLTAGHMCYVSRVGSTLITVGTLPIADYEGGPKCIVMWGLQSPVDQPGRIQGRELLAGIQERG